MNKNINCPLDKQWSHFCHSHGLSRFATLYDTLQYKFNRIKDKLEEKWMNFNGVYLYPAPKRQHKSWREKSLEGAKHVSIV
jgi:hypothetical protein